MSTTTTVVVEHSSGTDPATLILASLGVGLALLSLAWQALSFMLTGSRVRVGVKVGLRGVGAVVTLPHDARAQSVGHLRSQGFTDPVLAVEAINRGRGETSIASVDLLFEDGGSVGGGILDPPLPFRLIGESAQTWYFNMQLAVAYAKATESVKPTEKPRAVRGRVILGSRKVIKSKASIAIPTS
jgi:hypothetical protein